MDPMARMLCNMLKIKPEDLQSTLANIAGAANWFKLAIERIEAEQKAQRQLLERIAANVGTAGSSGSSDGNRSAGTLAAE